MTRTHIEASHTETSPTTAPHLRLGLSLGLTNPSTRFRKLLPYIGTALVIIVAVACYATLRGMAISREGLGHTYQVKSELADLELDHMLFHTAAASSLVDPESQTRVQAAAEKMRDARTQLEELTADNPTQQEKLQQLKPMLEQHINTVDAILKREAGGAKERTALVTELAQAADDQSISRMISDIDARETELLNERQSVWNRQFNRNIAVLAFAVGACLMLLFTNMHLLRQDAKSSRIAIDHIRQSADSYRALSARIIGLQDAERRRIGRELHDSIGQSLSALQMQIEQLATAPEPERAALVAEGRELVQRTAQEVRTMSQLLHPPLLDVVGFVAAAQNYVRQFARRSGIEVRMNFPEDLKLPSKEAELMLFRVLQESLTNVHRHAQATAVDVWLARNDHSIVLSIQDNGRGMPAGAIANFEAGMASGVGLAGMRERLAEFGGKLQVESSPSGTTVRASIPI